MNHRNARVILPTLLLSLGALFPERPVRGATLLYFNDGHEIAPVRDALGTRGGVARVGWLARSIRRKASDTLLVFGGDLGGGTLFGGVFHGEPMVEAFNRIPVDLAGFGQHDFDFGLSHAKKLVNASRFQWICSNLQERDGKAFAALPSTVLRRIGTVRLGFLAVTEAMETTTPGSGLRQRAPERAARMAVRRLRSAGATWIVALHQAPLDRNLALLRACPEVDLILSEEQVEDRSTLHWLGRRPIVSPCGNMGSLVRIDFPPRSKSVGLTVSVLPVDETVPSRPELLRLERHWMARLEERLSRPIPGGGIEGLTSPLDNLCARSSHSPLANLVTDAYRRARKADLALMHGGGLRAPLPAGPLTERQAWAILPFQNDVRLTGLDAAAIRRALEHGVTRALSGQGALLHVSGASYRIDPSRPEGQRLVELRIGNAPPRPGTRYRVALPAYLQGGGGGFSTLATGPLLADGDGAPPKDVDCLIRELERSVKLPRISIRRIHGLKGSIPCP